VCRVKQALSFNSLEKGQVDEAVIQSQKAMKGSLNDAKSHNELGVTLRKAGRLDEAIAQYEEALKMDPDYAPAHYNLGNAMLQKGQVNEAIAEYQAALQLKPDNVMVQRNIAHTIWALATSPDASVRNGSNAVTFAQAANETTGGNNALILRVLAAAYAETGNFTQAIQTGKKAVTLAAAQQKPSLQNALQQEISLYQSGKAMRADPNDMNGWQ
jgi:tetratricopeptide (TPR) repeat protein